MNLLQYAGYFMLVPIILSAINIARKLKRGDKKGAYRDIVYDIGLVLVALAAITGTWILALIGIIAIILPINTYNLIVAHRDAKKEALRNE
ncbi:hypothetical protein [Paenibacillus taichungensis]|jgi:type IV secretory pathway TrbD component